MGIQERKERERERRRQQIIVAAKKVFSEKGFNKATMDAIFISRTKKNSMPRFHSEFCSTSTSGWNTLKVLRISVRSRNWMR
jgi:hypothetical protein